MEETTLEQPADGAQPIFTMETPAFMGMSTDEGEDLRKKHIGPRKLDVPIMPCYVHGKLQDEMGYDIALFAAGHIQDVDRQTCKIVAGDGRERECLLLALKLPHAEKPTRAGFIIDESEAETVHAYLSGKIRKTSKLYPRPML